MKKFILFILMLFSMSLTTNAQNYVRSGNTLENRLFISPCWKACKKYNRCTERQANYLDIFDNKTQTIVKNPYKS